MIKILLWLITFNLSYYNQDIERTQYGVYCECMQQDILYCDWVTKQATTETQNGNTGVGKTKNNLFGFRKTKEYMSFSTLKDCLKFYKTWQDQKYCIDYLKNHNPGNYEDFLWWVGFKTGKSYSVKEKSYTAYLKRVKLNFIE